MENAAATFFCGYGEKQPKSACQLPIIKGSPIANKTDQPQKTVAGVTSKPGSRYYVALDENYSGWVAVADGQVAGDCSSIPIAPG